MKKRLSVTIDKDLLREIDSWRGSSPRSPLYEVLLEAALRDGLQLEGLQIEHSKGGGVSGIYLEGGDTRAVTHEIRGEVVLVRHVYNPSQCGGCDGLKESFGGRS